MQQKIFKICFFFTILGNVPFSVEAGKELDLVQQGDTRPSLKIDLSRQLYSTGDNPLPLEDIDDGESPPLTIL